MEAVGANDELRRNGSAGLEVQFDIIGRLREPDALAVQMNRVGFGLQQRPRQDVVQIAAMDGDVGKAIALDQFHAELKHRPGLPGIPQPDRFAGRQHLHLLKRILQSKRMENAGAVGADLHTGAELAQFRRLLVDFDIDPTPDQGQRRREPADTATDNDDFVLHRKRLPRHCGSPAALRLRSAKTSSPSSTT